MKHHIFSDEYDYAAQLLSEVPELKQFSPEEINTLLEISKIQNFAAGETIIAEGEYHSWVYMLLAGEVQISKGDKPIKALDRTGDLVGEMGAINKMPRTATVKASCDSYLIAFDTSIIDKRLKYSESGFCFLLYRLFAEVLASRLMEATRSNMILRDTVLKVVN